MRKLPEAEFDVMQAVWRETPPLTTHVLMDAIGRERGWKTPSLITLLNRLEERGFLRSEKSGKERQYWPLVSREEYLRFETRDFLSRVHGNSLTSFMQAMSGGAQLDEQEREELRRWLEESGR